MLVQDSSLPHLTYVDFSARMESDRESVTPAISSIPANTNSVQPKGSGREQL